jgi:hypothetical protein
MNEIVPGTKESPIYMKFLRDEEDKIDWAKILIMLALTVASGYLASKSQRWGSSSTDPIKSLKMSLAEKRIKFGHDLQVAGKAIEEAGWKAYENVRGV